MDRATQCTLRSRLSTASLVVVGLVGVLASQLYDDWAEPRAWVVAVLALVAGVLVANARRMVDRLEVERPEHADSTRS